jgi:PAS domain S-box-containing protein
MNLEDADGMAQALFEETGDAMVLFDPDTDQLLDANSTAQRLSGFPVRDLLRMTVKDLFRSATEEGRRNLQEASRRTSIFHSEDGYFLKTVREEVWVPVNLTMARLHVRPKTLGLITARDVRRQHEAHSQLRSVEAELRRVLACVTDCLWSAEIDESGRCAYHYFSPVVEKITGLPAAFFLSGLHRWWSVIHPEDQPRWSKALARQRAGQSTQEEYRVVWPDGTSRWVRETVHVSRGTAEHGSVRLDGVLADVSERHQLVLALEESEERFRAFMDRVPAVAFLKDADGRYFYVNRRFQEFFGKGPAALLRKTDADLFPADVANRLRASESQAQAAGQATRSTETVPGADGVLHTWLLTHFPYQDKGGRRFLGALALDADEMRRLRKEARWG